MKPETLALLKRSYTVLADIRHDWPGRISPEGQTLLCNLRDAISQQTGEDACSVSSGVRCDFVRTALDKRA